MLADLLARRSSLRYALPAAIAAAVAVLVVDQATKQAVLNMNLSRGELLHVFPGLNFRMAWNTGVNFGLFSGGGDFARILLSIGTAVVALVLLGGSLACHRMLSAIGLGVAAGGALGNTIDRVFAGHVVDFINVSCCGINNPWQFNVADIAVFVGFGLLLIPLRQRSTQTPAS